MGSDVMIALWEKSSKNQISSLVDFSVYPMAKSPPFFIFPDSHFKKDWFNEIKIGTSSISSTSSTLSNLNTKHNSILSHTTWSGVLGT